ncbi:MAG: SPOR domain-containing protein [Firmicutes bacterium]|nr:SPOR domain-containing protein [Bacillota bacterium]
MAKAGKGSKASELFFVIGGVVATAAVGTFLGYLVGSYAVEMLTGPPAARQVRSVTVNGDRVAQESPAPQPASTPSPQRTSQSTRSEPAAAPSVLYRVQVGAFSVRSNAEALAQRLKEEEGLPTTIAGTGPFRVQVGAFAQRSNAEALSETLKAKGYPVLVVQTTN